jgi:hypothetical protein
VATSLLRRVLISPNRPQNLLDARRSAESFDGSRNIAKELLYAPALLFTGRTLIQMSSKLRFLIARDFSVEQAQKIARLRTG